MSQTVELKVGMSCQGCVGAVRRVLEKMEGVDSFDIDKENQKVTVKGSVEPEAVLQTVSKTGKKTSFWEPAQVPVPEPTPALAQAPEPILTTAAAPQPAAAPAQEPEPALEQAPNPAQPSVPEAVPKPTEAEPKPTEAVSAVA